MPEFVDHPSLLCRWLGRRRGLLSGFVQLQLSVLGAFTESNRNGALKPMTKPALKIVY